MLLLLPLPLRLLVPEEDGLDGRATFEDRLRGPRRAGERVARELLGHAPALDALELDDLGLARLDVGHAQPVEHEAHGRRDGQQVRLRLVAVGELAGDEDPIQHDEPEAGEAAVDARVRRRDAERRRPPRRRRRGAARRRERGRGGDEREQRA